MTSHALHDEVVEVDDPCMEEQLHELSSGELEALFMRDFVSLITMREGQMVVAELFEPLPVSNIVLNQVVSMVKTNDVISANSVCRFKFILECQPWTTDFETAVGVWFNRLLEALRSLDPEVRRTLIDPDADVRKIRAALIHDASPSGNGSIEL